MRIKNLIILSTLLLSLLTSSFIKAHEISYTNQYRGEEISVSSAMEVKDDLYDFMQNNSSKWIDYSTSPWPFSNTSNLEFVNKAVNAWVSLKWTGTDGVAFTQSWEMTVGVKVQAWASDGTYLGATNEDLTINYIPGNKVEYDDWSVFKIKDAHRMIISITGISITDAIGTVTNYNQLPADYGDVNLIGEIQVERYYWLDENEQVTGLGHQAGDGNSSQSWYQTDERTIDIYWSHLDGAEEY